MNKDKKWNLIALAIAFVLVVLTNIFVLQFIQETNDTIVCFLIAMEAVLFAVSYTFIYIVPKSILRVIDSKKKEKKLAKIKHVSIEDEI